MIKILSENGQKKYGICHFTIDTPNDLSNLPTEPEMGSTCFVVSTSETYMINSSKEWTKIQTGGGGGESDPPTIAVGTDGLITATAGDKETTYQLSFIDDENFVAANIKKDIDIFGVTGTYEGSAVIPTKGFVPTEWSEDGYFAKGIWYGTTIPYNIFNAETALTEILLPSDITEIGESAFMYCNNLLLSELPSSLITLNGRVFSGCSKITIATIPKNVTTIKAQAFQSCTGLTSITFLGTPSTIFPTVFNSCTNLTTINVPWSEGAVENAPWGATNATINYDYSAS